METKPAEPTHETVGVPASEPAPSNQPTPAKRKSRLPGLILLAILLIIVYNLIGLYSIEPIGAIPDGVTVVIWRYQWNSQFLDSPDAQCLRIQNGVSLLCRLTALSALKPGQIILRLPYQEWAYLASTGGQTFDR